MRIGIDASRAFIKNRTGIEEYSYQVIKHLAGELQDEEVVLYIRAENKKYDIQDKHNFGLLNLGFELPNNWKIKIIHWPILWTQIGLSLEMFLHPVDVLFVPAHTVPYIHPRKTIVTIHGLEYEFCPRAYSFWERVYMRFSIKNSCRWATNIITVSENTKKDIVKLYGIPEKIIEVVYEGYMEEIYDMYNTQTEKKIKYILFVGRLEERKNILGIIAAFEILKGKYTVTHKLILAGKKGYGYQAIKNSVLNSKYKQDILLPGFVNQYEKHRLFQNADVFLFPTFYEGFGLPILEAQVAGVPVVTSKNSSIPEITLDMQSESALLVDPNDAEEIAKAAYRLISDKSLRDDIIKKGQENVRRFSWKKCANSIASVIRK